MVKNPPANAGSHKRFRFDPWVGAIPWRRAMQPTQAWRATVHGVAESDTTEATRVRPFPHAQGMKSLLKSMKKEITILGRATSHRLPGREEPSAG